MKIAVDFDGTIVEHAFPAIGKEKIFAFQTLKDLQKRGCQLILWTCRTGKELEAAIDYCHKNGLDFYAVNKNYPEEIFDINNSPKIEADIYIDDRNIGGFPGWGEVWHMLYPETGGNEFVSNRREKSFFSRFGSLLRNSNNE